MAIEKLYKPQEAAQILGISSNTLRTWRSRPPEGGAPQTVRIGRRVLYPESGLRKFIDRGRR